MPTARVAGIDLFYRVEGEGAPVLLVHGAPGTDHTWFYPGILRLAERCRVIGYDHAGHGRSQQVDPATLSMARLVNDIEGLRRSLGLSRVCVLGHSFGGFLALRYALAYPAHLAGLVLVGTAATIEVQDASAQAVRALAPPPLVSAREHLWNGTLDGTIKTDAELRDAFQRALPIYYHRRELAPSALPDMVFRLAARRALTRGDALRYRVDDGRLGGITAPALVTVGRHDLITPMAASERLAAAIPNAALAVFQDSGHLPFAEEPARFADVVGAFVRGVAGAGRAAARPGP